MWKLPLYHPNIPKRMEYFYAAKNLSFWNTILCEWKLGMNHHRRDLVHSPPIFGKTSFILNWRSIFHGSFPGSNPRTINFANNALHCIRGSTKPKPPWEVDAIIVFQATFGLTFLKLLDPYKKFLINLYSFDNKDLENNHEDRIYHIERSNTWLEITTLPTSDKFLELQKINFFLN